MAPRNRLKRNVDPRLAAVLILGTLAAVQYAWWQGLVAKPKAVGGRGGGGGGGGGPAAVILTGDPAARVDTIAGGPEPGYADGPGWAARFDGPTGLGMGPGGVLLIADARNNRIREMTPGGRTATIAGSDPGYRDGDVRAALFQAPSGVAAGSDGTIYVADTLNHRIRRIRGGRVDTLAGGVNGFVNGPGSRARFSFPTGIAVATSQGDHGDVVLVADTGNGRIRTLRIQGNACQVSTLSPVSGHPTAVAAAPGVAGRLTLVPPGISDAVVGTAKIVGTLVIGREGEGPPAALPRLAHPIGIAAAAPDAWYVVDSRHGALFELRGGEAQVLAGRATRNAAIFGDKDSDGEHAVMGLLAGVAADVRGHVYVSDLTANCIRRITLPNAMAGGRRHNRSDA